jgi:hypothetical protein
VLGDTHDLALLFKRLATLRTDALLFRDVETIRWKGPGDRFEAIMTRRGASRLLERCRKAEAARASGS